MSEFKELTLDDLSEKEAAFLFDYKMLTEEQKKRVNEMFIMFAKENGTEDLFSFQNEE